MQTPTGRRQLTHPIPRPRPDGPADLGLLADDLDHLASLNRRPTGTTVAGDVVAPDYPETDGTPAGPAGPAGSGGYAGSAGPGAPAESADWSELAGPAGPDEPAGPVFVDASGRRRKLARRASVAAVAVLAGYTGLLAVSFAGGPIPPNALLPVPGVPSGKPPAPASSAPVNAAPASGKSSAAPDRPTTGATEHWTEARSSSPAGAPGQSVRPGPQPTSAATSSLPLPPAPTGTSAVTPPTTTHGNPTPPGHKHRSPSGPSS